jgi:hypothetical protein
MPYPSVCIHNTCSSSGLIPHSTAWRADCARQHQETIDTVRSTAQEQVPFNVQGVRTVLFSLCGTSDQYYLRQYLDEFSKALASEVRMLLGEVGKLREERRALQQ